MFNLNAKEDFEHINCHTWCIKMLQLLLVQRQQLMYGGGVKSNPPVWEILWCNIFFAEDLWTLMQNGQLVEFSRDLNTRTLWQMIRKQYFLYICIFFFLMIIIFLHVASHNRTKYKILCELIMYSVFNNNKAFSTISICLALDKIPKNYYLCMPEVLVACLLTLVIMLVFCFLFSQTFIWKGALISILYGKLSQR